MSAYATPSDMTLRYDRNDIGQLCSDDKRPVSEVDLPTNPVCLQALLDGAGEIEAALLVSNLYAVTDLQTLSANSAALLNRMNCDVAMRNLINRRPGWNPEKSKAIRENCNLQLEKLRKGENVFNIQASMNAGEPVTDGPTTLTFNNLNLWRDRTRNFFPVRVLPFNR